MRARILVLAVNDGGDEYVETYAIANEYTLDDNPTWLHEKKVEEARSEYGDAFQNHGFIDVEIPDDAIAQVLRRHADAGVVAAEAVSEVRS